ncbi:Protein of unknown function [Gryllus bimaculatus]|nr:Protein of unknown function [Gryllus bimaculatus]
MLGTPWKGEEIRFLIVCGRVWVARTVNSALARRAWLGRADAGPSRGSEGRRRAGGRYVLGMTTRTPPLSVLKRRVVVVVSRRLRETSTERVCGPRPGPLDLISARLGHTPGGHRRNHHHGDRAYLQEGVAEFARVAV